jgi:chaperone required for assembly of F1-ATPase
MRDDFLRDWFPSGDEPARDPVKAAREAVKPVRPKRFYERAEIQEQDGAFVLTLDGRPARTPGRRPLAVPTRALGEALAEEWRAQGGEIGPATMPLTRMVNSTIDGVADDPAAVVNDVAKYAASDLVCYRAGEPDRLVAEQAAAWDPVLAWARDALDARFFLSQGVTFVGQSEAAVTAVRAAVEERAKRSPFGLAALHVMTTLTGSVLIALAQAARRLTAEEAWEAAHVDERFQERVWGEDEQAIARRAARRADFMAASRLYALANVS